MKYKHICFLVGGCILSCVRMFGLKMIYEALTNHWILTYSSSKTVTSIPSLQQIPPTKQSIHAHAHTMLKTHKHLCLDYLPHWQRQNNQFSATDGHTEASEAKRGEKTGGGSIGIYSEVRQNWDEVSRGKKWWYKRKRVVMVKRGYSSQLIMLNHQTSWLQ